MSTTDRPDALPEETARSLVEAMAEVARIRRGRDAGPGPEGAASSQTGSGRSRPPGSRPHTPAGTRRPAPPAIRPAGTSS